MSEYSLSLAKRLCDWDNNVLPLLNLYKRIADQKKTILVTTSWDDGHKLDIKLNELLKKYGINGTFYISPKDEELSPAERLSDEEVVTLGRDFEIGAHTMTHRHLTTLNTEEAKNEILDSKKYLESVLGREVSSFCYPAGMYKAKHVPLVKEAGFTYARTVDRFSLSNPDSSLEVKTSVHTYNHYSDIWSLLKFVRFNPITFLKTYLRWDRQAIMMFDRVKKTGGVFHLWGHSWEVDNHGDWEKLEAVLEHISGHDGVKYITNGEQLAYDI